MVISEDFVGGSTLEFSGAYPLDYPCIRTPSVLGLEYLSESCVIM